MGAFLVETVFSKASLLSVDGLGPFFSLLFCLEKGLFSGDALTCF